MEKYYMNCSTGEVTQSHREAMDWYREGNQVEIYSADGRLVLAWVQ